MAVPVAQWLVDEARELCAGFCPQAFFAKQFVDGTLDNTSQMQLAKAAILHGLQLATQQGQMKHG